MPYLVWKSIFNQVRIHQHGIRDTDGSGPGFLNPSANAMTNCVASSRSLSDITIPQCIPFKRPLSPPATARLIIALILQKRLSQSSIYHQLPANQHIVGDLLSRNVIQIADLFSCVVDDLRQAAAH